MIWSISWRNVWRNKIRSGVVIIAVTFGMCAGVFTTAFMKGWSEQRIEDAINTEIAHIQLHQPGFQDNYDVKIHITNVNAIIESIRRDPKVMGASKRIVLNSMASTAHGNAGAFIIGIQPETEKTVSNIHTKIIEGSYFDDKMRNPILIGEKLAKKLNLAIKKKIIISVIDKHGHQFNDQYKVCGIYRTDNTTYDEMHLFVDYDKLVSSVGFTSEDAHEIAVYLDESKNVSQVKEKLEATYPKLLVEDWTEISPEVGYVSSVMDQYMYMFVLIILLALCFGIINTMLMVILERVKELGMLMAVGMNRTRVFFMIMLETVFLTFTGGAIGIGLGYFITCMMAKSGLDLSVWGEGLRQMGYSPVIFPSINLEMIVSIAILVILTGVISAIYPAYKALKLRPAEALSIE